MESEEVELEESATRPVGTGGGPVAASVLIGVVALAGAVAWGFCLGDGFRRFFHAYLLSFFFYLSLSLGALFFVLIHHLTRAGWSVVVRRVAELLAANLLLWAFLALPVIFPVVFGNAALYPWADAQSCSNGRPSTSPRVSSPCAARSTLPSSACSHVTISSAPSPRTTRATWRSPGGWRA